jgi:DNA repair protein RadC
MTEYSLRIADMATSERPRERLLAYGAGSLASAELLAILLGTGQGAGKLSAIGLAQLILRHLSENQNLADPIASLQNVTHQQLMQIHGVGEAKASTILAAVEIGKRVFLARPPDRAVVHSPQVAVSALSQDLMYQQQERFALLLLDSQHRILSKKILTIGTATETIAHPRDIFGEVLRGGAVKCMVAHNHPSGNVQPSQADLTLTEQLLAGSKILDIPLLDHLILGNGNFCSLRETTNLWND